jgi:hypothetical protein
MQPHIIEHNNTHGDNYKMIKTFSNSNSPFLMDNLLKEEQNNTILKEKTSLTVGITASYSIVQHQESINGRNCNCGSEDCNSYINSSEESISPNEDDSSVNKMDFINDVCTCCDKNNDNNSVNDSNNTTGDSKPILKFSVSAILGDRPTPCTGKYIYFYYLHLTYKIIFLRK